MEKLTEQLVHYHAVQLSSSRQFYISLIYGFNQGAQRRYLWEDRIQISQRIREARNAIGDFNSILHSADRIGRTEVLDIDIDIKHFADCVEACEFYETRSNEAYYSLLNKAIWSRIDRTFVNDS